MYLIEAEGNVNSWACYISCFTTEPQTTFSVFSPSVPPDTLGFCCTGFFSLPGMHHAFRSPSLGMGCSLCGMLHSHSLLRKFLFVLHGTEFSSDAWSPTPFGNVLHFLSGLSLYLVHTSLIMFIKCSVSCSHVFLITKAIGEFKKWTQYRNVYSKKENAHNFSIFLFHLTMYHGHSSMSVSIYLLLSLMYTTFYSMDVSWFT